MILWAGLAAGQELSERTVPVQAAPPEQVLELGAASLDVEVRSMAIGALVRHAGDRCASPWVARGRHDPSEYVRRETIAALGEAACREVLWSIAVDTTVDATTRALAADLSGEADPARLGEQALALQADGRAALYLLVAGAQGNEPSRVRLVDLARAGNLPLERELYPRLDADWFPYADVLAVTEPEARPWIAASWLRHDVKGARSSVRRLLHDRDPEVVLDTVEAIRGVPGSRPLLRSVAGIDARLASGEFTALARAHLGDPELQRRLDAIRTLAQSSEPRDRDALRNTWLQDDLDDTFRLALARAIAAGATAADRPLLEAMLLHELLEVRVVAARALLVN